MSDEHAVHDQTTPSDEPTRRSLTPAERILVLDLFTFLLKRENRRVYLVVYLDDHSRFIVGCGRVRAARSCGRCSRRGSRISGRPRKC
jgi:hypothetical protein